MGSRGRRPPPRELRVGGSSSLCLELAHKIDRFKSRRSITPLRSNRYVTRERKERRGAALGRESSVNQSHFEFQLADHTQEQQRPTRRVFDFDDDSIQKNGSDAVQQPDADDRLWRGVHGGGHLNPTAALAHPDTLSLALRAPRFVRSPGRERLLERAPGRGGARRAQGERHASRGPEGFLRRS